jgi:hypothetical protein
LDIAKATYEYGLKKQTSILDPNKLKARKSQFNPHGLAKKARTSFQMSPGKISPKNRGKVGRNSVLPGDIIEDFEISEDDELHEVQKKSMKFCIAIGELSNRVVQGRDIQNRSNTTNHTPNCPTGFALKSVRQSIAGFTKNQFEAKKIEDDVDFQIYEDYEVIKLNNQEEEFDLGDDSNSIKLKPSPRKVKGIPYPRIEGCSPTMKQRRKSLTPNQKHLLGQAMLPKSNRSVSNGSDKRPGGSEIDIDSPERFKNSKPKEKSYLEKLQKMSEKADEEEFLKKNNPFLIEDKDPDANDPKSYKKKHTLNIERHISGNSFMRRFISNKKVNKKKPAKRDEIIDPVKRKEEEKISRITKMKDDYLKFEIDYQKKYSPQVHYNSILDIVPSFNEKYRKNIQEKKANLLRNNKFEMIYIASKVSRKKKKKKGNGQDGEDDVSKTNGGDSCNESETAYNSSDDGTTGPSKVSYRNEMSKEISEKNLETQKKMFPIGMSQSYLPIMNMLDDIGKAKNPQAEIFQAIVA